MRLLRLILKNIRRNPVRSTLTVLGTMVMVCVVTLVWSVLSFLNRVTSEKAANFKAIVTERWKIPSQMPFAYAGTLSEGAAREANDVRPQDSMTWQFYGGALVPINQVRTPSEFIFAFSLEPKKLATMMDDLDDLPSGPKAELEAAIARLEGNRQGIIIGREKLAQINKRIGERIKLFSVNYKGIDLEFEIVGTFPDGRYNQSSAFNRDYLNAALDNYQREHKGQKHPMAEKTLNLVWLRVPDVDSFTRLAEQVTGSPYYSLPAVKCETASSGISAFLDAYKDLIWGMRWLLTPAIIATLSLVIANAISISVRERRKEMAVLKVLGFRPNHILVLVLGESVLMGTIAGLVSVGLTYYIVNHLAGGIKFPIAFFPAFFIPAEAVLWGVLIGAGTAILGSIVPAWSARSVKVADVFAKTT